MHRASVWFLVIVLAAGAVAVAASSGSDEDLSREERIRRWIQRWRGRRQPGKTEPEKEEIPEIDPALLGEEEDKIQRKTCVSIDGQAFHINGRPTYRGVVFRQGKGEERQECKIEGLLLGARMANAVFDDLNPASRDRWKYPDGPWDPERSVREFLDAMAYWRRSGLAAFAVNLQGGCPEGGSSRVQPWQNSAYTRDGRLRADYMGRLERIIDQADTSYMVVILGLFDHGQDQRVWDERSVLRAVDAVTDWLLERKYTNVLLEISNACSNRRYDHAILTDDRVHELVKRVQERSEGKVESPAGRLLASASMDGGALPPSGLLRVADFALLHGDTVDEPERIRRMVEYTRGRMGSAAKPILFSQDDHGDFDQPTNNMMAAVLARAGWLFHDYRRPHEGFHQGFDSPPVDWGINSVRKYRFFGLLAKLTHHSRPYLTDTIRTELKARKKQK